MTCGGVSGQENLNGFNIWSKHSQGHPSPCQSILLLLSRMSCRWKGIGNYNLCGTIAEMSLCFDEWNRHWEWIGCYNWFYLFACVLALGNDGANYW